MQRVALAFTAAVFTVLLLAQTAPPTIPGAPAPPLDYVCPMDPDVRAAVPGKCPRCGMTLRLGIPDEIEYPLDVGLAPRVPKPGERLDFTFRIRDPRKNTPVTKFETVHEKLFHLFIVSQDLDYFVHDHPVPQPGGVFTYSATLPKRGLYRILGDYYPTGGIPQLTERTIIVPGGHLETPKLAPDLAPKHTANMDVELVTEPPQPLAGFKTLMFFRVKPADGLEKYIGALGHMLAASDDLIDLIHTHPFLADGGPQIQFNVIFPRARTYRLWVQFQRKGVVNTAIFTVPVQELK
jgi:Heavy metal binding domain